MAITTEQKYLLNNKMGKTANKVQLGTLIENAEDFANVTLADGKILVGNGSGVAAAVTPSGDVTIDNAGATTIGANKVTVAKMAAPSAGTGALLGKKLAYALFDPSAVAGDRTVAAHAMGGSIPDNAFVTGMWYWVETTLTSATDAATVAIHVQAANDCVSAVAISDGSNPWDTTSKPVEGIPKLETTSTWLATTAARQITATVDVEALTAGKIHIWCEYLEYL